MTELEWKLLVELVENGYEIPEEDPELLFLQITEFTN